MSSFYEHDEIHRGLALKRAGRSTEAEGIFKAILAKNPKNEWARVELASFLTDFHAQETLLQEGIKAGYPSANLKVALSQLFSQQGNFEQAAYYAKQAVKEAPKNSATHGLPTEKWSSLMYGFRAEGGLKYEQETQTLRDCREASPG